MKRNIKIHTKLAIVLCCMGAAISCSNDLDEKVYSKVTEQSYNYTTDDFAPTVASVYNYLRTIRHDEYWATQEFTGDIIVNPPNSSGWDDGGVYRMLHYHKWTSEQSQVRKGWESFYKGVILCNIVLQQIETEKLPAPSDAVKQTATAELRAVRAYYYWQICDNFGDAPLFSEPITELPEKSTRQEIFDFIVSELKAVIPSLSEEQGGTQYGRLNKWGAKALLANIYLNGEIYTGTAYWNECIAQCDDIINSGKCALSANYSDSFRATGTETSKEILFTIPYDQILAGGQCLHMFSWHGELQKKFNLEATPWGSGSSMGITQFIDTYDPDDVRLQDTWLMGNQYASDGTLLMCTYDKKGEPLSFQKEVMSGNYTNETDGYRMNKFEVLPGTNGDSSTDFPIFRYAQVLTMKAECLLRTGQSGAGALVTQVRQRNFKSNPAQATVSDDDLKGNTSYEYGFVENYKIVNRGNTDPVQFGRLLDELGWEFAWEMHRRRDLIRFGVFTKKSWLSHEPQGDYRTVFPIPENALTSNPKLTQNPNYKSN